MPTRRIFVRVGGSAAGGPRASSRLPADATPVEIRAERERLRVELRKDQPERPEGFAKDVVKYLEAKTDMPTYKERVRDMALWVAEFHAIPRDTITPVMIGAVRARWLTVGPRLRQRWVVDAETGQRVRRDEAIDKPLSASTVNHRLRALENFYTVLNGRHGKNPVREVSEATEPDAPPRAIPPEVLAAILGRMRESATKARLRVMEETGLPQSTLMRVAVIDFNPQARTLWIPGRRKGHGTTGWTMPLTRKAVAALRAMAREDAWGDFSTASMQKVWDVACAKLDIVGTYPYLVRHSFATRALAKTGDLHATQRLLGHSTVTLTERYARAAVDPALAAARDKIEATERQGKKKRKRKGRQRRKQTSRAPTRAPTPKNINRARSSSG